MDQSEEVTLLSGDGTSSYIGQVAGIPNLCIPPINMEDGPSGVGDGNGGVTAFPDGENAAATWDPALIQQEGTAKGAEFAGKGVNVSLGPTTNLVRDPRWGRTYETYGEDPYLAGQITSAEVKGLQSQGVMADVKHVAAYDQEQYPNGGNNETVSQQALEELYLAPFQTAIEQSAPGLVHVLLRRGQQRPVVRERRHAAERARPAGELRRLRHLRLGRRRQRRRPTPTAAWTSRCRSPTPSNVAAALANGTLSQATVNAAVARILTQMFAFGMFDNPARPARSPPP